MSAARCASFLFLACVFLQLNIAHGLRNEEEDEDNETSEGDPGIEFYRPPGLGVPHRVWPGGRMPCDCEGLGCGCCAQMVMSSFNFNRTGCMNLTYDPYDFAVVARLFFGEAMLFERSFSGKNPPPLCMPIPLPPVFPNMDFCVRFYDIYTPGRNLHLCMDWEARLQRAPVIRLRFDCVRVGMDGLVLLKPEDGDGFTSTMAPPLSSSVAADAFATTAGTVTTQDPDSVYDPVAPGRGTDATMTTITEENNEDANRSTNTESAPTTIISTTDSSLTTIVPTTDSSLTTIVPTTESSLTTIIPTTESLPTTIITTTSTS